MSLLRNHDFLEEMRKSISYNQYKRFVKVIQEDFYLLETEVEDLLFKICGSTKNVYTIAFDKSEHTFKCNCPDMSSHCLAHNCLCKHIVFVLLRVLKYSDTTVYKDLKWNEEKMAPYFEKLKANNELLQDNLITNQELIEKYKSRVNIDGKKEKNNTDHKFSAGPRRACSNADLLDISTKEKIIPYNYFKEDYECAICYDIMDIKDDDEKFVGCPTCKQSFHKLCIKRWLENAVHKNCVYCRSGIWSEYNKKKVDEYINLV
jgi:hypothetical protein